jgi:hypothetical protein
VLLLLFLAIAAWAFHKRAIQPAEQTTFAAAVLFSLAIAYTSCAAFAHTRGEVAWASPWYSEVLLAPVVGLAYLGMSRTKAIGPALAACTVAIWTWVLIATWTIKLFPMYSGAGTAPIHLHEVWNWYMHSASAHTPDLALLALAPPPLLYAGLLASVALSIFLSTTVIRAIHKNHL